ncbi:MAG TPA: PIN domain-containing protein [Patescibacteria group bacterium]
MKNAKKTQEVVPMPEVVGSKEGQETHTQERSNFFHPRFMGAFADEVAKLVIQRLPKLPQRTQKKKTSTKNKQIIGGFFLDTSAIIDNRIFDIIKLGLLNGVIVVPDSVLLELKHIADSKDPLKKDRGRKGLEALDKVKKIKGVKVVVLPAVNGKDAQKEVDEQLISITKSNKGKLITCDYNLEKKASVHGVTAINMHALAQMLKIAAVPGEKIFVKIVHIGKDTTQGVGYLDDGTMIVVENGSHLLGQDVTVTVARVIQTSTGKILFARQ